MKKSIFIFIAFFAFSMASMSQNIPNPSFEQWTNVNLFENPQYWYTSNSQMVIMGMTPNCTKVTDAYSGQYAARVETLSNGQDTVNGLMLIGIPGNQGIDGGHPYAGHPDTVVVHLKYNIMPNDTGFLFMLFKNNGSVIGSAGKQILGTQGTYASFKLPVSWIQITNADTIGVLLASSNLDSPEVPGSFVQIDSIEMIGTTVQFPNAGFENWISQSSDEPDGWQTLNYAKTNVPSATKVTDSYSGTYAIRIETINTIWSQLMGYITNGQMGNNGPEGGVPIPYNPSNVTGFYKYTPVGNDTAFVMGITTRYDVTLDSTIIIEMVIAQLPPINVYTPFSLQFNYNGFPYADTMNLIFASSNMLDSGSFIGLGSALYLDSINVNYLPVGISKASLKNNLKLYPNPAKDILNVELENFISNSPISVCDNRGSVLMIQQHEEGTEVVQFDVSALSSGIYFVKLQTGNNISVLKPFSIVR